MILNRLTLADVWIGHVSAGLLVVKRFAFFAMVSLSVVLAPIAHATTDSAAGLVNSLIKVARVRVVVTVAHWKTKILICLFHTNYARKFFF